MVFDALDLNGVASTCVAPTPPPTSSLISACGDFVAGTNAAWPFILEATTVADGAASQSAQTFTMNVTSLPAGGANVRVYKTTANGSAFFASPVALTLGSNSITVASVSFDRAVKFQFSSGDVVFDALDLNGVASTCVAPTPLPTSSLISACGDFVCWNKRCLAIYFRSDNCCCWSGKSISSNIYNECNVSASWWSECESI